MMIVNKGKLSYIFYFLIINISVLSSLAVIPSSIQTSIVRAAYLLSIFFVLLNLDKLRKIKKKYLLPLFLMLIYSTFLIIGFFYHGGEANKLAMAIFSFVIFLIFLINIDNWTRRELLTPFVLTLSVPIILSTAVWFGVNIPVYTDNISSLEQYEKSLELSTVQAIAFSGVFLNQNALGIFAMLFLMVSITYQHQNAKKISTLLRYALISLTVLAFILLIKTMSRASILAFFSYVVISSPVFLAKFRLKEFVFLLLSISALATIIFINYEYIELLLKRTESSGSSGRVDVWKSAYATFLNNKLLGVGHFTYNGLTAHNFFVDKLASNGVFVFLSIFIYTLYVLAFGLSFGLINLLKQKSSRDIFLYLGMFFAVVVNQLFETQMGSSFHMLYVLFIFCSIQVFSFKVRRRLQ